MTWRPLPGRPFSRETVLDLYVLYASIGRAPKVRAVAHACRCSPSRVSDALKQAGIIVRPPAGQS